MLVDRLEAVINSGSRMPLSTRVFIDEREALDVLDLMRTTVPEEIKQARRINTEREKILSQAQSEANRLVNQAQERVERLVSEDSVRTVAEERAKELLDRARNDADEIRRGADEYALELLDRLDGEVRHIQGSVRSALSALHAQPTRVDEEE